MGITLDDDELWEFVTRAHTGIVTTLTKDGWPVTLPTWFVVRDRQIWIRTPARAKKVHRVRNDPRASFLAESGDRWAELKAVHLRLELCVDDDPEAIAEVRAGLAEKYDGFRPARAKLPDATKQHYSGEVFLRGVPVGAPISWDNARIRLRG